MIAKPVPLPIPGGVAGVPSQFLLVVVIGTFWAPLPLEEAALAMLVLSPNPTNVANMAIAIINAPIAWARFSLRKLFITVSPKYLKCTTIKNGLLDSINAQAMASCMPVDPLIVAKAKVSISLRLISNYIYPVYFYRARHTCTQLTENSQKEKRTSYVT
jgi:hypothetical protein